MVGKEIGRICLLRVKRIEMTNLPGISLLALHLYTYICYEIEQPSS